MNKPIFFTKHAEQRVLERFADFGLKNAARMIRGADREDGPRGRTYYNTLNYTFVVKERPSRIVVITMIKKI